MNEKRLKVLFISSWYPTRSNPLNGIFIQRHAEALAYYCHVAAVFPSAGELPGMEVTTEKGVLTIRTYFRKAGYLTIHLPLFYQIFNYISAWRKAIKFYIQENGKPDIIHANIVFPASLIAAWYSFTWKVSYLITEQWTGYFPEDGRYKGFFRKKLSSFTLRRASAIITVSTALKNRLIELKLCSACHVISNIVDTTVFTISQKSHSETVRFIHVSLPDENRKNIPGIIRAFHIFNTPRNDSTLTLIVGNDLSVENLKQLCLSLGLNNSVRFLGWKPKEELAKLLQDSDAFILFSRVETQGIVLLEAMSCGKPVISSRCGAPEEFITSKNGLLVDIGREDRLAEAMALMADNRNNYDAMEIRNSVADLVNAKSVAQKIIRLYNDILKH